MTIAQKAIKENLDFSNRQETATHFDRNTIKKTSSTKKNRLYTIKILWPE